MKKLVILALLLSTQVVIMSMDLDEQLFWAIRDGNIEQIKGALDAGADVNAIGKWDWTPLMFAIQKGLTEGKENIVEPLLERGAMVNTQNEIGETSLHILANTDLYLKSYEGEGVKDSLKSSFFKTAQLLFAKNPDITLKNSKGETALVVARTNLSPDKLEIFEELYKKTVESYRENFLQVVKDGKASLVKYLLSQFLWSNDVLENAFQEARQAYANTNNKDYAAIGRMILQYLQIVGPRGLISTKGLAKDLLPDELKQEIATRLLERQLLDDTLKKDLQWTMSDTDDSDTEV